MNGTNSKENGLANTKYQVAPQREPLEIFENRPKLPERTCCQKCALSSCLFGFVFIVGGIISALLMKPFVHHQIEDNMVLMDGGQAFLGWKDPPVTPLMKLFFFNLTNFEAFLGGRERPRVKKVGPYVYHQEIHKVNVSFDAAGETVTYSDHKSYSFAPPPLSLGSEDDLIVMPNLPLLGALRKLSASPLTITMLESMLRSHNFGIDKNPFLVISVREFLWGYPSLIMSIDRAQACTSEKISQLAASNATFEDDWEDWDKAEGSSAEEPEDECAITADNLVPFGLMVNKNQSVINTRTVNTGKRDLSLKGQLVSIEGSDQLGFWSESRCNSISGTDPGTLPTDIQKDTALELYFESMCRSMKFRQVKCVKHNGIQALRFSPLEETFNSGAEWRENSCYCSSPSSCPPSGIFDLGSGCKANSPVYMSWPHFLHGDPELREGVDGIDPPDRDLHSFLLDIQPDWGTTLAAHARFQMNVRIEKSSYSSFRNIKKSVYLPFLFLEEGIPGPSKYVEGKMKMLLGLGDTVQNLSALIGIAIGFLMMIPEVTLWIRSCCCTRSPPTTRDLKI